MLIINVSVTLQFENSCNYNRSGCRQDATLPSLLPLWPLTRKEMSREAPPGDGVIRLELNPHVVVLRRDDLRFLRSTKLPIELRLWAQTTAHLHIIIFTHLTTHTHTQQGFTSRHWRTWPCTSSPGDPRHCPRSRMRRTPVWCDTERAPPAATRSSCWVGTLWASRGWWGSHWARRWCRHRQLLVGQSNNFSGRRATDDAA